MKRPTLSSGLIISALLLGLSARSQAETTPPQPINLLSDVDFLVLTGAGIQNLSGPSLGFNGNIGTSPSTGATITGIGTAEVNGKIYTVDATGPSGSTIAPSFLTTAKNDMTTAYNDGFGRVLNVITQTPELGGLTLAPGLYWSSTGFTISTGDLTLDAGGNPNGVWIFQAGTAGSPTDVNQLTTRHVTLAGGALAQNVFWVCRTGILGTDGSFRGTILAQQSVTNAGNDVFEGRQLAFTGSATFNGKANPSMSLPGRGAFGLQVAPTNGSYIYPSPTHGNTATIVYTMVQSGSVRIRIYNESGRLVDTITDTKSSSLQTSPVSVGKFAPGVYFYLINMAYDDGSKETQAKRKFVVLH
jgi:hypothetical protein